MANSGPHNGSQFYITLAPAPGWMANILASLGAAPRGAAQSEVPVDANDGLPRRSRWPRASVDDLRFAAARDDGGHRRGPPMGPHHAEAASFSKAYVMARCALFSRLLVSYRPLARLGRLVNCQFTRSAEAPRSIASEK